MVKVGEFRRHGRLAQQGREAVDHFAGRTPINLRARVEVGDEVGQCSSTIIADPSAHIARDCLSYKRQGALGPNGEVARGALRDAIYFGPAPHASDVTEDNRLWWVVLFLHAIVCAVSLAFVGRYYSYLPWISFATFDSGHVLLAGGFAIVCGAIFTFARFSFGYLVGFYLYTLTFCYLLVAGSSTFPYDHVSAATSAFASLVAFLLPVVANWPAPKLEISDRHFVGILSAILMAGAIFAGIGATISFKVISPRDIYTFRDQINFDWWLRYPIGALTSSLLPFAFASFYLLKKYWRAAASLLLLLVFYPVTLTKMTLFAPAWMIFLTILSRFVSMRIAAVFSLLLPLSAGLASAILLQAGILSSVNDVFSVVNFRMVAVPAMMLDFYNDFFATNPHTLFCQISFIKNLMGCSYQDPLSIVLRDHYQFGTLNASLLATEGVASVGLLWAPVTATLCGIVVGCMSRASSGLPDRFVLLSGGILVYVFMNVPLTTILLTHGGFILAALWLICPRHMFEK